MKELTTKEIQNIQLDILKAVAYFCDKNEIKYFLGCGTLCGAIVRNGFFPWDDDIDILIPRKDYEKFLKIFEKKGLKLLSCKNKDYYYPYAKVVDIRTKAYECKNDIDDYGVFIDVFPLDGVPNKLALTLLKIFKYLMMSKWGCYLDNRNFIIKFGYKIVSFITIPFSYNLFPKIVNKICMKHSIDDSQKTGVVVHYRNKKELVDSSLFDTRIKWLFEDEKFYIPERYDEYLKALYGDYYKEDECCGHKHFKAYWKE